MDIEGLIGLKLQAVANDPTRRRQDDADIVALLALHLPSLDRALLDQLSLACGDPSASSAVNRTP